MFLFPESIAAEESDTDMQTTKTLLLSAENNFLSVENSL